MQGLIGFAITNVTMIPTSRLRYCPFRAIDERRRIKQVARAGTLVTPWVLEAWEHSS